MNNEFNIINQTPPCKYFSICGGCTIQNIANHKEYKFYLFKEAVKILPCQKIHEIIQIAPHSRRRVNLKVRDKKICFNISKSKNTVAIDECILLESEINKLIAPLNHMFKKISCIITSLNITNSDTGIEIVFYSNKKSTLDSEIILSEFSKKYNVARIAWQIGKDEPYAIIQNNALQLKFNQIAVDLPINSFLQVSKESNDIINKIIAKHLSAKPILELYCGAGSFSIPMEKIAPVTAFEGNKEAINALNKTASRHKLSIKGITQDLYQTPVLKDIINKFTQTVINPPRNGATPQIKQIVQAKSIEKLILISCSVENFIRDSKILLSKNFILTDLYPVDQFLYSNHLEVIGVFSYKQS